MDTPLKLESARLIEKQHTGNKLNNDEIHTLMLYCIELLDDFERMTQESIARIQKLADEKLKQLKG